ncbi:MATE family efflux transporter [Lachnobacterium bovis]|uniref:MATE family efflux transporter n=1 Tax=Lachnobacterium bovis TaxID=140626 RepID=UPI000AE180C5|nr:MATE family efflux transporter [Lachnobacterium bovis]
MEDIKETTRIMDEKELSQYEKLILTPIKKLIPKLAIPTVISMMITMIYNLVDAFFVGKIGTSASASTGILLSVQAIFQAVGFMFGHGSGSNISVQLGMGKRNEANKIAALGFFSAIVVSIVPMFFGLIFIDDFMRALGSTETILPYARSYGFYILISGPALTLSCILNNIIRYEGKAFFAMIGLVSGGVLNMFFDPIFMFGLNMGIHGAGLSTAISQYISLGILYYMFWSKKTITEIKFCNFEWNTVCFCRIIKNGLPSLIRQSLNSVSTMTLNICAMPYGDSAIAAMAIVGRVAMFIGSTMVGIGQGFQPVSAFNYGAKKYKRIRKAFWFTFFIGEGVLGIMAIMGMFFPAEIVRVFRNDDKVVEIGRITLMYQCIAIIAQPMSIVTNMLFQSIGKSKIASFTAALRSGICYIPTLIILPKFIGLTGVECAQMISDIMTTLICLPFTVYFFARLPRKDEEVELDRQYMVSKEKMYYNKSES